jgi:hypothetical protein
MNTKIFFALTLLVAGTAGANTPAGSLPNGWIPTGKAPGDYDMIVDRSVARDGRASGLIRSRGTPNGFGSLAQHFKADKFQGKRVAMTGWVRTENVKSWAGLWFRVDTPVKGGVSFDNMQRRPIRGSTDWKKYALVLDVPKDASEISFGVLLDGEGAAWIDALQFEEVSTQVPVTDIRRGDAPLATPQNLDFEKGPSTGLPEGWRAAGAAPDDYVMTLDRNAHGGREGVLLRSKDKPKDFGTLMQAASGAQYRGQRVRMSAWVRTEDVKGWAGLWLRVDDAGVNAIAFDNMETRQIKGTTPWTRYSVVLDVSDQPVDLAFGTLLYGEGKVWVDDFTFEVVGKDVPVTDILNTAESTRPRNLGFEE